MIRSVVAAAVLIAVGGQVQTGNAQIGNAQPAWPQRPVTLVVPFGAGGSADLIGRIIAARLQAAIGVTFVVDNKGGAGGSIGAGFVAKAPNDGYTLLIGTASTNAINAALYARLPYDVERDFQPVSLLGAAAQPAVCCNPKLPVHSVNEPDRLISRRAPAKRITAPPGSARRRICRSSCSRPRPGRR